MKRNLFFILALLSITMVSCHKENAPDNQVIDEFTDYTIPFEAALDALDNFMFEQGLVQGTKGSIADYIDNYFVVNGAQRTKSADAQSNVLYAVNFKDDAGYALLAADSRIGEDILAVVETGNVQAADFDTPSDHILVDDNDDLSIEEYNEMVGTGVLASVAADAHVNQLCLAYAQGRIEDCPRDGGSGGGSNTDPVSYEWRVSKSVPQMLTTLWTQTGDKNLFNKYCPTVGLIWKRKAPVGCVGIAVSQIMAYHEFPSSLSCNGMNIDYSAIKNIYSIYDFSAMGNDTSREMLARFVFHIASWCNTRFHSILGEAWGFAWPSGAKECLSLFGYKNVSLDFGYNEDRVIASLDAGCPVFMSAVAGLISGHAWVVDGYIKRNYVSSKGTIAQKQTLVHCNWGWHGDCNGYFTSGVFKTQKAVISDGHSQRGDENYWYGFNTITYDNPKK